MSALCWRLRKRFADNVQVQIAIIPSEQGPAITGRVWRRTAHRRYDGSLARALYGERVLLDAASGAGWPLPAPTALAIEDWARCHGA